MNKLSDLTKGAAVANHGGAMGVETISKNGRSSKNQTSRRNNQLGKIFFILVAIVGFGISANAQDLITLKNGDDIKAVVQEIGEVEIKYKKYENLNGPTYTMKKSEIFMIRYENGSKDVFADLSKPTPIVQNTQEDDDGFYVRRQSNPYKFRLYTGPGSGHSYGGVIGYSVEPRFNSFAFSAGIGLMDNDDIGWSIGAKWYFWKNLYVNSTIGTVGTRYEYEYSY